jgi:tripartite-type tricarboxylate transporter receptor subunit TctC
MPSCLVALAVAADHRSALMPEVPTAAEAGAAGLVAMGWNGVYAPAGTPAALVGRLNAEANAILREPATAAPLADLGAEATPGSQEAFQAFTVAELAKWREVAQAARVTLD